MPTRAELFRMVDEAFDAERAKTIAASLTEHYRSPGSSGYLEATDYLGGILKEAGFESLEITDYPIERAWDPRDAVLSLQSPEEMNLVDFQTAPSCIAWWSDSTPPEGEVLEVVDVGTGESPDDFEGLDVRGRAVFIHGTTRRPGWWEAARLAAGRGARGMITDYMLYQTPGVRTPELVPEATQLLRIPREIEEKVWAFSISHSASVKLRRMLKEGRVFVRARVQAETAPSVVRNVLATIEGSDLRGESVLFCAHASGIKPGANCAEGAALVVELARAIRDLIEEERIQRPARSLRFLICCEGEGVSGYLRDRPEQAHNTLAALTYCSPGHRQDATASNLMLFRSPDSVPSFINDYLVGLVESAPGDVDWVEKDGGEDLSLVRFAHGYYTPWSDNTRFASEGIPAPLFMSWPDRYFHSQFLTPEVIDPRVLRRAALVSGAAGIELASAGMEEAEAIAREMAARAALRLTEAARRYRRPGAAASQGRAHLLWIFDLAVEGMRTTLRLVAESASSRLRTHLDELEKVLRGLLERELEYLPTEVSGDAGDQDVASMIPRRTVDGQAPRWAGLSYRDLLDIGDLIAAADEAGGFNCLRVVADEAWRFVDGRQSMGEIADAVSFEFDLTVPPRAVHALLRGLERAGYVSIDES